MTPLQLILLGVVLAPGAVFALFSLLWLLGWDAPERALTRTTAIVYSVATAAVAWMAWAMHMAGLESIAVPLGDWFTVHDYHFPLVLLADRLSLPFLALTVILVGLIGQFSATYLHRDPGFARFYILLHLFAFGALLIFSAGSFDLIIGGWEMVGLTSVLLISFFHYRLGPVEGALHVFTIYRACDIGLITAAFALHHYAHTASFVNGMPQVSSGDATVIGLLLLLSAAGKSAQVPFSGWLPRAMESPTPSSAIFYGAISVHAGAYLLLRAQPILAESSIASGAVVLVGLMTALHGTIVGRTSADAKTSLAYAALAQVGVVFMEIGCPSCTSSAMPWSGRSSFCALLPCCATTIRCTPPPAARWRKPANIWNPCSRRACNCGSTGWPWIAAISTPFWSAASCSRCWRCPGCWPGWTGWASAPAGRALNKQGAIDG